MPLGELRRRGVAMTRAFAAFAPSTALVAAVLAGACGPTAEVTLTVDLPLDVPVDPGAITLRPASAVRSARLWTSSRLTVVAEAASHLTLRAPGLCPVELSTAPGATDAVARPWIDLGGDHPQVGFGAPFEIAVIAGCDDAARGKLEWHQLEGPPLLDLSIEDRGFHLRARTRPLAEIHPGPYAWGIVPVSPRTQGRYTLEATWVGAGPEVRRTVVVTSIARATGIPSIAVGQRVILGGSGAWRVAQAAPRGHAQVELTGGALEFEPDAAGNWRLEDESGRALNVRAGLHDHTPLDCGRSNCHATETEAAKSSPMIHALEKFRTDDPTAGGGCMLDCHVVGERGLHDGGFLDVARRLGQRVDLGSWQEMPRAMRRVAGVTCTGCHGPAAIPDRTARRSALSADVCATCHDAPPRYVHVEQWRGSRMARADAQPSVRGTPACARCHTTAGFLADLGIRKPDDTPDDGEVFGIACAACHAPHGAHVGETLIREIAVPEALGGKAFRERHPISAACVACHAPGKDELIPSASAGALWTGRAVLPGGELLSGPSPHDAVGECTGCHGGRRPTDHSFRVDRRLCGPCHSGEPVEKPSADGRTVRERAVALWKRFAATAPSGTPPHASVGAAPPDRLGRALYEIALVLEDPAAASHNAAFARQLLDDAETYSRSAP
jgi:Cytochrome c7 and related cytochrome c